MSVNEEFQSTNEELLTSKEELQSLNEELTALNNQLQETLDRQRTTSDDLQNVLYSTDVATIFLDVDLNIRFFTPATKSLFNVIASDVGRPLADLASLCGGQLAYLADARAVLAKHLPIERQIEARSGAWYHAADPALPDAEAAAWKAWSSPSPTSPIAKAPVTRWRPPNARRKPPTRRSRAFSPPPATTCASRCKPWPCCRGCWRGRSKASGTSKLVARIGETLGAMTGMLNALLDINQIEAGVVRAEMASVPGQ